MLSAAISDAGYTALEVGFKIVFTLMNILLAFGFAWTVPLIYGVVGFEYRRRPLTSLALLYGMVIIPTDTTYDNRYTSIQ